MTTFSLNLNLDLNAVFLGKIQDYRLSYIVMTLCQYKGFFKWVGKCGKNKSKVENKAESGEFLEFSLLPMDKSTTACVFVFALVFVFAFLFVFVFVLSR